MAYPELPPSVVDALASEQMREHHMIWHYVRVMWPTMNPQLRERLRDDGWMPPRLATAPGAGVDFLGMHREMIRKINQLLKIAADATYQRVQGWDPIPWDHADAEWAMPPQYPGGPSAAKEQLQTDGWRMTAARRYERVEWLRAIELDALGTELESGIHNWLHMHWASEPWFHGALGQDRNDPRNNYLGDTYSSHVNKAFWKLHGWLDDRIGAWERATGRDADLSGAWLGPPIHHHIGPVTESRRDALATDDMMTFSRNFFANRLAESP